jgi:hypothetical protein
MKPLAEPRPSLRRQHEAPLQLPEAKRRKRHTSQNAADKAKASTCPSTRGHNESPNESSGDGLCQRCQLIFESFPEQESLGKRGRKGHPRILGDLGTLEDISNCPLCVFFQKLSSEWAASLPPREATPDRVGTYRLTARSAVSEFGLRGTNLSDSVLFAISSKKYSHSWFTREHIRNSNCYFESQPANTSTLYPALPARSRGLSCLQISPLANFVTIKQMLDFCDSRHAVMCKSTTPLALPGFHILDCESAKLVSWETLASEFPAYVTLSYVWGNVAEPSSTDPNKLSREAPQLIQDAMEVTRRLGYKYLWVDRYCIPQDDVAAKHTQIKNMNEIYAKSAITIIASAANSPCDGLPGVSIERSPRQESVVVRNRRFTQIMTILCLRSSLLSGTVEVGHARKACSPRGNWFSRIASGTSNAPGCGA